MNSHNNLPSWQQKYNNLFIGMVIISLLAVMWASAKQGYKQINGDFFQKEFLIQQFNQLRLTIGDRVFAPNVLVGVNGWLDYTGGENMDDYQNAIGFSEADLQAFNKQVELANQFGQEKNIEFLIVIAPNKATIYPDKLPAQIKRIQDNSRLDQVIEFIPKKSNVRILDVRSALRSARNEEEVYFKTDTHWNHFGAYIVYSEIIKALSMKHPNLMLYDQGIIQFIEIQDTRGLARMIKAAYTTEKTALLEANPKFVKGIKIPEPHGYNESTRTLNSSMPSVLVYHDSFGDFHLNNYLMLNFSKANFIHLDGKQYLNPDTIEYFQPNIIIIEIVERNLYRLPGFLSKLISE